jgi:hypothetical protein
MRFFAAALLAALPAAAASAKLEIRDVQASYGQLGPERKSADYFAGDEVYFRYTVTGVRTDAEGRLRGELHMTLADAEGKVLLKTDTPIQQVPVLGAESFPGSARWTLDVDFPPGEYEATVEFADLIAKESVSFRRKFTVKAPEFAPLRVRFSHDAEGRVPARVGGTVGQTLCVKMSAVGFDSSKGEIEVEMEILILDAKGNPVTPKPIRTVVHNEKPEEVKQTTTIDFSAKLGLNRTGDFVLRVTLTDKMAKKKTTFEAPLRVTAP